MKKILTVLKFELGNYFGSKSFMIPTILICILCVGVMFFPRIKDSIVGDGSKESSEGVDEDDIEKFAIYDPQNILLLSEEGDFASFFNNGEAVACESVDEVKNMVSSEEAEAGFVVNSLNSFDYYIYNKGMFDTYGEMFSEYMSMMIKYDYCEKYNLDVDEFFALEYTPVEMNENVLGKDSTQNYWYCYILVIIVFMLIVMYGMTIATSVANEKSNRSIEIMVTSTSSNAILFGKVFAGAIASVFQFGAIAASLLGSYQANKSYWGDGIAMFLDIPSDVLITFAIFGLGGFLFYAFMYGALGALVSKIEDLNKSAGTAQMIVMLVYMVVLLQLTNVDGIVIKVCSFLPISSYSAMFARVAMGNVATWEVIISAVLLYAGVVGMGFIGGKIFRSSTLRYGNPIKLTAAFKNMKEK